MPATNSSIRVRKERDAWRVFEWSRLPDGRESKRRLGRFPTKKAAEEYAISVLAGRTSTSRTTAAGVLDEFVATKAGRERNTVAQYEWAAAKLVPLIGDVKLGDLSQADVAKAYVTLAPTMSQRSLTIISKTLRASLEMARDQGSLSWNPAKRVTVPLQLCGEGRGGMKLWSHDDVERFLGAAAEHRLYAAFVVAVVTGLRRAELLGLRWEDLDEDRGRLSVEMQLVVEDGRPLLKSRMKTKTSKRSIAIGPELVAVLRAHRRSQLEERMAASPGAWPTLPAELIFRTELGGAIDPNNFGRAMDRLVEAAGVPRITPHGIRHTAATHALAEARTMAEVRAVADALGHSTPRITMDVYQHAMPERDRELADRAAKRYRLS